MKKYQTFYPRLVALILDSILLLPLTIVDDWIKDAKPQTGIQILTVAIGFAGTFSSLQCTLSMVKPSEKC